MINKNIKFFTLSKSGNISGLMSIRNYLMQRSAEDPNFTYTVPLIRERDFYWFDPSTGINPPVDSKIFYNEQGLSVETEADVIVIGEYRDYDSIGMLSPSASTGKPVLLEFRNSNIRGNEEILDYIRLDHGRYELYFEKNKEGFMQYFENFLAEKKDTEITKLTIDEIIARAEIIHAQEEQVHQETYQGIDVFYSADVRSLDQLAIDKLRSRYYQSHENPPSKISVLCLATSLRIYTMDNGVIKIKDNRYFSKEFMEEFFAYPQEEQHCIVGLSYRPGRLGEIIDLTRGKFARDKVKN